MFFPALALVIGSVAMSSCRKSGCDEVNACNYDADVKVNDGTCIDKGQVTFWTTPATSSTDIVVTLNATEGTITEFLASAPACDAIGCATFSLCPGTYSYEAHQKFPGTRTWTGSATSNEEGCTTVQFE